MFEETEKNIKKHDRKVSEDGDDDDNNNIEDTNMSAAVFSCQSGQ